jgi:hypothetical protein
LESHRSPLTYVILIIVSIASLGGVIWTSHTISSRDSGGEQFWIEWIGVRAKVVDGVSPYSTLVSARIRSQIGERFSWAPNPEPAYTSPLYSATITLPFTFIANEDFAHSLWLVIQSFVLLGTLLAGIRLVDWKPRWWVFSIFILLILLCPRNVVSWYEGSMTIWVSGLVAAVLIALRGKRYELAGALLALTMIRPQVVILWVALVLLWAGSHRKWGLIIWFLGTLLIMIGIATILVPEWPMEYLRIMWNYGDYYTAGTPGYAFQHWWPGLGRQMGWVLSGILVLILFIEWRVVLRRDFRWFLWTSYLTITVSQWIGIPTSIDAHLLLNIPLIFVYAMFEERWQRSGKWVGLAGVGIIFAWELWLIYTSFRYSEPTIRLGLMFPVPLLLLIGLYWVRWWSIRPKRLLSDELRTGEMA